MAIYSDNMECCYAYKITSLKSIFNIKLNINDNIFCLFSSYWYLLLTLYTM